MIYKAKELHSRLVNLVLWDVESDGTLVWCGDKSQWDKVRKVEDETDYGFMSSCCCGRADEERGVCLVCGENCDLIEDK